MKKIVFFILVLLGGLSVAVLNSSCQRAKQNERVTEQQVQYTCPMHPEIVRDEPGKCPICGMDLVEMVADTSAGMMMNMTGDTAYMMDDSAGRMQDAVMGDSTMMR